MSSEVLFSTFRVALVGSPNSGKTTLFNALTGARQKTGNYAGVTVEKREGNFSLHSKQTARILDLPGAYSLDARTPDEAITAEVIQGLRTDEDAPKAIIAVADLTNLERNLYLVLQLIELKIPTVLALTMSDLARKNGIKIKIDELARQLGIPVVLVSARKMTGIKELIIELEALKSNTENNTSSQPHEKIVNEPSAIIKRYQKIESILKTIYTQKGTNDAVTKKIDRVLLHKYLGPLFMLVFFAVMFQLIFSLAQYPMDAIEEGISLLQGFLRFEITNPTLQSLLIDGIVAGVGAVVVFLPQIILLFGFIIAFEDSGYMARAAFILDRLMGKVGLHGRAFIPLLSSFACAIPGIMAARAIENRRDRLITIMISPLMTCSARIPIYTLLIGTFFSSKPVFLFFTAQGLVMTGLYLFGIAMALAVAFVLKKTALKGKPSPFIMELPTYKLPSLKNITLGLWDRASIFLRKAGTIILGISIALWFLASYPKADIPSSIANDEKAITAYQMEHSAIGVLGKTIEPAIRPLGFDWKIGIALLSSFAAREVVLSTLGTVYSIGYDEEHASDLGKKLQADGKFTIATALSLLVFYALACQCMSTLAVTRRETNSIRWPIAMFAYMTGMAYICAFLTYNIALRYFV